VCRTRARRASTYEEFFSTLLEGAWVVGPVAARLGALQQSMARYPNIAPGQEFAGY
jgi:hypothetical protein